MANSIFRVNKNKENPYVMINKKGLQDERLSWKAKGILAYLLTLPDDWKIYLSEIETHAKDGRDSLSAGIKELIKFGYVVRNRLHDEKRKFKGYEYCVYEIPLETISPQTENPYTENPQTEKPYTENPQLLNNYNTNKLLNINNNKAFSEIVKIFNQNIHPITPREAQQIGYYLEDLNVDYRVIIKAIDEAIFNNKRSLRYIETILQDWHSKGLTTLEAVEAYVRDYQDRKNKKGATKNGHGNAAKKESGNAFEGYKPPEPKISDELAGLTDEELDRLIEEQGL